MAWILLGRRAHAEAILTGNSTQNPVLTAKNIDEAIGRLSCPDQTQIIQGKLQPHSSVVHRDGWIFQFISWLTCRAEFASGVMRAPQIRPAEKGFDGILVELSSTGIDMLLLMEDKATDTPRETVRVDVWDEFEDYEQGRRDNELTAEICALLEYHPDIDISSVVSSANWYREKRYRVSVASSKNSLPAMVHTFKGYDGVVTGSNDRRLANLFITEDMREFFEKLAQTSIAYLETLKQTISNV